jgi:hypothetical protein
MRVEGDRAILTFDTKGRGLTTRDGKPPRGFAIAAATGWWRWSTGTEIKGDELIVTGRWINDPAFVHYAWGR